jgi:hypothetical protein
VPGFIVTPSRIWQSGVRLVSHVVVAGRTTVGARTRIYPFASIGHPPQDRAVLDHRARMDAGLGQVVRPALAGLDLAHSVTSTLGDGVRLVSHVVVAGRTTVGARTRIYPFASIGHDMAERPDLDAGADHRAVLDHRARMDAGLGQVVRPAKVNGVLVAEAEIGAMLVTE